MLASNGNALLGSVRIYWKSTHFRYMELRSFAMPALWAGINCYCAIVRISVSMFKLHKKVEFHNICKFGLARHFYSLSFRNIVSNFWLQIFEIPFPTKWDIMEEKVCTRLSLFRGISVKLTISFKVSHFILNAFHWQIFFNRTQKKMLVTWPA